MHIPISAVLVVFNDARHLDECLQGIKWCDEILVVDLGSTDNSVEIAQKHVKSVLHHEWVPIAEIIRTEIFAKAKNEWILCVDPDEIYPSMLSDILRSTLVQCAEKAAIVLAPIQYYFRGKPLTCCMWYPNNRIALMHRCRAHFNSNVHSPSTYFGEVIEIHWNDGPAIIHYWKDSWPLFLRSHWRYVKLEGRARYESGRRFSTTDALISTLKMIRYNLVIKKGYHCGLDGVLLSFAMGLYEMGSHLSLLKYQFDLKRRSK